MEVLLIKRLSDVLFMCLCCVTCSCRRSSPALTMKDARRHPSNRPNGESLRIRYTHTDRKRARERGVRVSVYTFSSQPDHATLP
jgi:hypothetical protein